MVERKRERKKGKKEKIRRKEGKVGERKERWEGGRKGGMDRKRGEEAGKMKEGRREKNQTTSKLINLMQN